jgi:HEAT repeat protein
MVKYPKTTGFVAMRSLELLSMRFREISSLSSLVLFLSVFLTGAASLASVKTNAALLSSKKNISAKPALEISTERGGQALDVRTALRIQVLDLRIQELKQIPKSTAQLVLIYQNKSESMAMRWRALTAYARIQGRLAYPELSKALNDKDWYMRNAALVSMSKLDTEKAKLWAKELLSDRALVVRMAAVEIIEQFGDDSSKSALWKGLEDRAHFRGQQSLFIRKRIIEALSKIEDPGSEKRFIDILSDRDETLHRPAISALERITRQHLGTNKDRLPMKRAQWQQWWLGKNIEAKQSKSI